MRVRHKEWFPKRESPAEDPQREELYHMEDYALNGIHHSKWTRADIAGAIKMWSDYFEVDRPSVVYADIGTYSGDYLEGRIRLSTTCKGRSPLVVAHEFAHHVTDTWDPESRLEGHGPEFAGVYGDLLSVAGLVPHVGYRDIARRHGVRILDTSRARSVKALRALVYKRTRAV